MAALQPLTDPWEHCLNRIGSDIPQQQFNTWIRPLQAQWQGSGLILAAPNRFIRDFVTEKYVPMIATYLLDIVAPASAQVLVGPCPLHNQQSKCKQGDRAQRTVAAPKGLTAPAQQRRVQN